MYSTTRTVGYLRLVRAETHLVTGNKLATCGCEMARPPAERMSEQTGLARTALAIGCVVIVVFGFFSGTHLTDEHGEVHTFEMEKYADIGSRHRADEVRNRPKNADAFGDVERPKLDRNGAGKNGKSKNGPDPNEPVDWANVPCKDMSLRGRKFMVVSFVDEQVRLCARSSGRITALTSKHWAFPPFPSPSSPPLPFLFTR